jgi:hypothetical protein
MACRTCRQSVWAPASARVRPPDTRLDIVPADQFLLRTPGSAWPGDGHGVPLERPVGRTSPVQCDRTADGSGPSPDSGGQAADTSSAQRPTMRLASWPRPTTRPTRPGPDRTGQQCACSPSANPSRYQHRDLSVVTTCTHARCRNVRKPGPRPMSVRSCPASTMDATIGQPSGHHMSGRSGRTPSTPPDMPWRTEATWTGNGRTAWKAFGHPRSPRPQGGPLGHAEPPPVGPALAAWQPRLARRRQDCQRDRNHDSDQAATWCRSTVQAAPRCTAVLKRESPGVRRRVGG